MYADLIADPRVLRVVALSGGYTRDDANQPVGSANNDMIASFLTCAGPGPVRSSDRRLSSTPLSMASIACDLRCVGDMTQPSTLRFFFGTMGSGKSTQALQIHHNLTSRGLRVLVDHPARSRSGACVQPTWRFRRGRA